MAKNRTMQQKNLTNKKRIMKEKRERRFDVMCQEYKDDLGYYSKLSRAEHLYKVPTTKAPKEPCKKSGFNPYRTSRKDMRLGTTSYEIM